MTTHPTSLVFSQPPTFLSPGEPLETWEVITDTNCTYEIESNGTLVRKDKIEGTRWVTREFTGSFTISNVPKHSLTPHMYLLFVVCGVVKHMALAQRAEPVPLLSLDWRWMLDALVVNTEALESAKTYRGCLKLIQEAETDPGFKTGDSKLDCMIGMALCRPALVQGKSARNALECLEDFQLRAVVGWHKAHLNAETQPLT